MWSVEGGMWSGMWNVQCNSGKRGRLEWGGSSLEWQVTTSPSNRACHARRHSYNSPRLPRNLHVVSCHHLARPDSEIRKNTQHDTSKVLRLPREVNMNTSKVLRLPRKMELIFWKPCKSIAPVTQNDLRHSCRQTCENVTKCHACHAKRHCNIWQPSFLKPSKMTGFDISPQARRRHKKTTRCSYKIEFS